MLIADDELSALRRKPAYRAGRWAYRYLWAVFAVYVVLMVARVVPFVSGVSLWAYLGLYLVGYLAVFFLFRRAGLSIVGRSAEARYRRGIVNRDAFLILRRRP